MLAGFYICFTHRPYMAYMPNMPYYYDEGRKHAERLQGVGPYEGFDASTAGVEPHKCEEHEDGEGDVPPQHETDDVAGHEELGPCAQ